MTEIVLSSIRQHFKDFYQKPKERKYPNWREESLGAWGPSLRDLMYTRDRGVTVVVDEAVGADYAGIEKRITAAMDSKYLIQMAQAFGMGMVEKLYHYDESHHVKPEELYGVLEKTKTLETRSLVGAGKNPFAEHTIRGMKGKRK